MGHGSSGSTNLFLPWSFFLLLMLTKFRVMNCVNVMTAAGTRTTLDQISISYSMLTNDVTMVTRDVVYRDVVLVFRHGSRVTGHAGHGSID